MKFGWLFYALMSALCAAVIPVFAKKGMVRGVDDTLATTIRAVMMAGFCIVACTALRKWSNASQVTGRHLVFIAATGLAGAASWLFYFKAIHLGDAAKVAPIDKLSMPLGIVLLVLILGEQVSKVNWAGIVLIVCGAFLASIKAEAPKPAAREPVAGPAASVYNTPVAKTDAHNGHGT